MVRTEKLTDFLGLIDDNLNVEEQIRGSLDFVQYGAIRKPIKKAFGVGCGKAALFNSLQRYIGNIRENHFA